MKISKFDGTMKKLLLRGSKNIALHFAYIKLMNNKCATSNPLAFLYFTKLDRLAGIWRKWKPNIPVFFILCIKQIYSYQVDIYWFPSFGLRISNFVIVRPLSWHDMTFASAKFHHFREFNISLVDSEILRNDFFFHYALVNFFRDVSAHKNEVQTYIRISIRYNSYLPNVLDLFLLFLSPRDFSSVPHFVFSLLLRNTSRRAQLVCSVICTFCHRCTYSLYFIHITIRATTFSYICSQRPSRKLHTPVNLFHMLVRYLKR